MWKSKLTVGLVLFVAAGALALGVGAAPLPRQDVGPLLRQAREAAQAITDPQEKFHALFRIAAVQNETGTRPAPSRRAGRTWRSRAASPTIGRKCGRWRWSLWPRRRRGTGLPGPRR